MMQFRSCLGQAALAFGLVLILVSGARGQRSGRHPHFRPPPMNMAMFHRLPMAHMQQVHAMAHMAQVHAMAHMQQVHAMAHLHQVQTLAHPHQIQAMAHVQQVNAAGHVNTVTSPAHLPHSARHVAHNQGYFALNPYASSNYRNGSFGSMYGSSGYNSGYSAASGSSYGGSGYGSSGGGSYGGSGYGGSGGGSYGGGSGGYANNSYGGGGYGGVGAQSPFTMPAKQAAPQAAVAQIEAILPNAGGDVWFDGEKAEGAGMRRVYVSPPLQPGETASCRVIAVWGAGHRVEREVQLTPGMTAVVDFRAPRPTTTIRPTSSQAY
jgi:hypothetical protein